MIRAHLLGPCFLCLLDLLLRLCLLDLCLCLLALCILSPLVILVNPTRFEEAAKNGKVRGVADFSHLFGVW